MSTPIGHGLFGLCLSAAKGDVVRRRLRWVLLALFIPITPDLDFMPGVIVGDANRYHQQISHSLAAAVAVGVFAALVLRTRTPNWRRDGSYVFVLYLSHLIMDFFVYDGRPPYGQPLLWPVVDAHFQSPWTPLRGIRHGVPGQDFAGVVHEIVSVQNVRAVGREILFTITVGAGLGVARSLWRTRGMTQ